MSAHLEGLLLIEDTRQQIYGGDKHANIRNYFNRIGIPIVRQCLPYGDYALCDRSAFDPFAKQDKDGNYIGAYDPDMSIVVDTKRDVLEIAGNLTREHKRFRSECVKAQEGGSQLIILVEELLPEGRMDKWKSPVWTHSNRYHTAGQKMTLANPEQLRKQMLTMQEKYGVKFRFCDGRQTGKYLLEYLQGTRN